MISKGSESAKAPSGTQLLSAIDPELTRECMNDADNSSGYNKPNPSHLTRFPYQRSKPAPKGNKYNRSQFVSLSVP
jgi:hypothetical protein